MWLTTLLLTSVHLTSVKPLIGSSISFRSAATAHAQKHSRNDYWVLLNWLQKSLVCVQWGGALFFWYRITAGVKQECILSPALFAIYMDTLITRLRTVDLGCTIFDTYYSCLLYADDIFLLSHSLNAMHLMLELSSHEKVL